MARSPPHIHIHSSSFLFPALVVPPSFSVVLCFSELCSPFVGFIYLAQRPQSPSSSRSLKDFCMKTRWILESPLPRLCVCACVSPGSPIKWKFRFACYMKSSPRARGCACVFFCSYPRRRQWVEQLVGGLTQLGVDNMALTDCGHGAAWI